MRLNILIFILLAAFAVFYLYMLLPSKNYYANIKPMEIVPAEEIIKLFNEVSWSRSLIMDTKYSVYSYEVTLSALEDTCHEAWSIIPTYKIGVEPDYYDCEDISMLILSHLRLKLKNAPCFVYVYYNDKINRGHAMIACAVYKNGKLKKLYYDIDCTEKDFKLGKGYKAYIIG